MVDEWVCSKTNLKNQCFSGSKPSIACFITSHMAAALMLGLRQLLY